MKPLVNIVCKACGQEALGSGDPDENCPNCGMTQNGRNGYQDWAWKAEDKLWRILRILEEDRFNAQD